MTEKSIVLSISVLASRKKELVRRCLDSLRPIMERISSELILVDTSEDEAIHEMLLTYSDHVVRFHWCDDFAKARNAGLERARGEWFLYLDDDEWFENADVLIGFFESGEYRKYDHANYIQRNYYDEKLINYSDVWASRMTRRREDIRFRSKIHEYLYPQEGRCLNLHLIAGHTGYIFQTQEDRLKHFERNHTLLLDMIEQEPKRLRWRVQLAQELQAVQKWEELLSFCEKSLAFCKDRDDACDNRDLGTFYAGAAEAALNLDNYDKVEQLARDMRADRRCSELCHAYVELLLAQAYFRQRKWQAAGECVAKFNEKKEYLEAHPEKLSEQEGALIVESAFDSIQIRCALSLTMGCALMRGDSSVLRDRLDELEWDQDVIYVSDAFFPVLLEGMAKQPLEPVFVCAMQLLWKNCDMQPKLTAEILGWGKKDVEAFRRLLRIAAQAEGTYWYQWYARVLTADMDGDMEALEEGFRGFCQNAPEAFYMPEDLSAIVQRCGLLKEEGYFSAPLARWDEQLLAYIAKAPLQDILLKEREMKTLQTKEGPHVFLARMRLSEGKVLHSDEAEDSEADRRFLAEFAERAVLFARAYYRADIIQNMPELLPEYAQAALFLSKSLSLERADRDGARAAMQSAADSYPAFSKSLYSYMNALDAGKR